ncbi:hypothetical protein SODALDRAFT_358947 [Sodiomyces alkalinus F11]|uniref:Uncharacterized protein n=1 Tax=Sodiomyces alkalinus (strain CBS 110278 / VKM F-3762 / F11) TaxID=1314773 RepID=A0A3N2PXL1_SODAK|nr:hypothetical protein SODALDRAFT_358947 [Sodiomyces alkalinus F11]ROT39085.1 hypothetical protein SODALDRAFT_358947 [Sodiomyces alkalinus F11]
MASTIPMSTDFSGAKTSPYFVEGRGQNVYWQNCWAKVYGKGHSESREQYPRGGQLGYVCRVSLGLERGPNPPLSLPDGVSLRYIAVLLVIALTRF